MNLVNLAQVIDRHHARVCAVMKLTIAQNAGNFFTR